MDWRAKLTKAEKLHLRVTAKIRTKGDLERQINLDRGKQPFERCMECKMIARKLGMEVD